MSLNYKYRVLIVLLLKKKVSQNSFFFVISNAISGSETLYKVYSLLLRLIPTETPVTRGGCDRIGQPGGNNNFEKDLYTLN